MKTKTIAISILLLISFNFITAGGVVKIKQTGADGSVLNTSSIYVKDGILRMATLLEGKEQIIIFDSDDETMYQIIDSEKKYITFSKFDLEKANRDIDDGMEILGAITKGTAETLPGVANDVASFFGAELDAEKEVEKAVGNLKGEDQKIARDAMAGDLKGYVDDKIDKPVFSKVESGVDFNGWKCDKFVGTVEDKKVEEVWITKGTNEELADEFAEAFSKFESFLDLLAKPNDKVSQDLWEGFDGWFVESGIPVKQTSYKDGNVVTETVVEEIKNEELSDDLFEAPDGYKKENPFRSQMDDMFNKFKKNR